MSPGPSFEPEDTEEWVLDVAERAVEDQWHWGGWRNARLRDVLQVAIDAAFEAAV